MSLPKIYREDNCIYLIQDVSGFSTYDKAKAIVNFCDKETKLFEKEIDRVICEILEKNHINIPSTDKSVLKLAFDLLKAKGKDIVIKDLFKYVKDMEDDDYCVVKETRNKLTVALETSWLNGDKLEILQCGCQIIEKEIK